MSTEPTSVSTTLVYFVPPADGAKAYQYMTEDPTRDEPVNNYTQEDKVVQVENLRGREDSVTLDKSGFQFFRHPVKHTSFANDQEIQDEYYPESADFIKKVTGASCVVFFDHTVRRNYAEKTEDTPDQRQPVQRVHVDQTPDSAVARVHRHMPAEDVDVLLSKRFQILNLWRPIHNAAYDFPLGLCDYSTVDTHDLVETALKWPDREGATFGVKYNPAHGWKYVRGMAPEEGVLFKCFDSVQDGSVATHTPHTAFVDPSTPADAPKRESIELRALVFYD